jgi:aspartyl protease family protein
LFSARHGLALVLSLLAAAGAQAQKVTFNGAMGDKALLVIDGQARMVPLGATVQGVKLLGLSADEARIDANGQTTVLRIGAPVNMGGGSMGGESGNQIVLSAGLGGHFFTSGAINGRTVQFLVDTGATSVSIGQSEADRIGLDYRNGSRVMMNTANGSVPGYVISLNTVRVGEVTVHNVQAVIVPAPMDHVLLGNSFLTRFQMKRDNDTLRLEKKP